MTSTSSADNPSVPTPSDETRSVTGLGRAVDAYIAVISVLCLGAVLAVSMIEATSDNGRVNWVLFGIIAVLLVATEVHATAWLKFGGAGSVTPSWTFTFCLMLLGSPTGAIAAMGFASVVADLVARKESYKLVFNVSQICLSLAIGALILFAFDIHGPLLIDGDLPTKHAVAMILSGIVVFGSNGAIICRLLATIEKSKFWTLMRESFALSMSADAAMLALAPILLITASQSLLMLPLIGTATFFIYQTARHAIARAHEANHDALTQLLNRRAFGNEIDSFVLQPNSLSSPGAVFILDLDRFKEVNDRLGHQIGDHVLHEFGQRLISHLPDGAVIARLGGDEFAVLLTETDVEHAASIASHLHEQLQEPLNIGGFPISAGTSIGVAYFPEHGQTSDEVLHAADVAMYRAKRYRSGVEVYQPFETSQQKGRVGLLGDVGDALANDEFVLEYQPQLDVERGVLTTAEALLRWNHPVHGRVNPAEFIALAEHTDLIGPITDFVIDRAIRDVASISDELVAAVNVSARNLADRHFASRTLATLAAQGFPTKRLEIEITETALAIDPELTSVALDEFRCAGVRVSIDDFGTGYSSFSTLRRLSVDGIKIDRSFITNAANDDDNAQIVTALISLAHGLKLTVVAEGVETLAVRKLLESAGCDILQGYLISVPLPLADLADVIAEVPPRSTLLADHPVSLPAVVS